MLKICKRYVYAALVALALSGAAAAIPSPIQPYAYNFWLWVDQGINVVFLGDPRETVSSRLGRYYDDSAVARVVCTFLDIFEPNHCIKSIDGDLEDRETNG